MANIPGLTNVLPGVITDVVTQTRGVAIPGGSRIAAIIGEGVTDEVIVSQALGSGQDGLNSNYTSTSGADGRHFRLTNYPIISNRTTLFKNGVPLVGTESLIDNAVFSNKYDYRIDIASGKIELQRAHLVDQGGAFYVPLSTNTGDGYFANLTLLDANALPETWTIRCVGVQRDALNAPIAGTAKFLAFGSVSGSLVDANGNPIIWVANGTTTSNSILSFAIYTTTAFVEGDAFTVKVASGVLNRNDSLSVTYIPSANLNDPVLLQGMIDVTARHGVPSTANTLSLGAQLAFANNAPAVITVQAAPPMPRRTSYDLADSVDNTSLDDNDFIFPLPPGVVPDFDSNIHFFVTNNTTKIEDQILPNKLDFYTLDTAGYPTTHDFITDTTSAPAGYSYFYTVKQSLETLNTGTDGYIGRNLAFSNQGVFSSSVSFDSSYVGKALRIIDSVNSANIGVFKVTSVSNGKLYVVANGSTFTPSSLQANPTYLSDFLNQTSVSIQIIDPVTGLQLDGYASTDAAITTSGASTGQASLTSVSLLATAGGNYNNITNLNNYKIQVNSTAAATSSQPIGNKGLYDIVSHTNSTIVIKKALVNESNMRYEVIDPNESSNYVVINKNVVPNGYGLRISIVNTKDASFFDAGWINALESLEKVDCDIVVPLPTQTTSVIFQNTLAHCKTMSNMKNKRERVMLIGAISGLSYDNLNGNKPAAVEDIGILEGIQGETVTDVLAGNIEDLANYSVPDAFGSTYRCIYFYPDQIVVQAGTENVLVDGFFIAAAAAGYLSADVKIENPLTNKVISGFTILRNKQLSPAILEQLATAGVCTLQPVAGGGRVIWGITTSQSGFPEEQEISIIFIRDRVAKVMRAGFAGYIGQPEDPNTGAVLNTRAVILLNSLASQNLITKFKDLVVQRDSVDPRQWNISCAVKPNYPVNWIYIKIAIGDF